MYQLTKTQKEIQKAATEFAKGEFEAEQARELEKGGEFPGRLWEKAGELGFIGVHFPEEYGGGGLGLLEQVLVSEAFCVQDPSLGPALSLGALGAECFLHAGAPQGRDWLPGLADGSLVSAWCGPGTREDQTGWDTAHGVFQASMVLNSSKADLFFVPWAGEPDPEGNDQSRVSVVPRDRTRIHPESRTTFLGLNLSAPGRVSVQGQDLRQADFFQVPSLSKLRQYMTRVFWLQIGGICLGLAQGALDRALAYAGAREQFGGKIIALPAVRHKLARMAARVTESRLLVYQGAALFDQGKLTHQQAAVVKLRTAEYAREVADEAVQILGGYGYMKEYDLERFYREAKACEILGGSGREQLEVLAGGFGKRRQP